MNFSLLLRQNLIKFDYMKKNFWIYIVSAGLCLVAAVGMLLLLFLPRGDDNAIEPVNLYVEDITLEKGQVKTDFYQISAENYEIDFDTDCEGVIEIDAEKIVAVESGVVKVDVTVEIRGNLIEESFYVTVLAQSFSYKFENVIGCSIDGDDIMLLDAPAQFKIRCFDANGLEIANPAIEVVASEGINASFEFGIVKITASNSGTISFAIAQSGSVFTMNVLLN